jgi:hypothetical protein
VRGIGVYGSALDAAIREEIPQDAKGIAWPTL